MQFTLIIAAIVAVVCFASADATWCHQSSYAFTKPKPTCANLLKVKLALFKTCGLKAVKVSGPAAIPASIASATTLYYYQVGCGKPTGCDWTLMQVVKNQAVWTKYDACEHAQAAYNGTFAGKGAAACKTDGVCPAPWCHLSGYSFKTKPNCKSLVATKQSLYKACGFNATMVSSPTAIPGVVADKTIYYYQVACNGKCAANSYQLMQVVKDQATWSTYDTCEHAQAQYNATFAGYGATACKGDSICAFP